MVMKLSTACLGNGNSLMRRVTVLFAIDFRKTLPVVPGATRADTVLPKKIFIMVTY